MAVAVVPWLLCNVWVLGEGAELEGAKDPCDKVGGGEFSGSR